MEILLVIGTGLVNVLCFCIGAKVGQMVQKGETIKAPTINPVKLYNEHIDKKEAEAEKNRLDVIMRNIEKYDGTGKGQEDVPR